jgi:hypothetical protein
VLAPRRACVPRVRWMLLLLRTTWGLLLGTTRVQLL